jgi:hypothetical protein
MSLASGGDISSEMHCVITVQADLNCLGIGLEIMAVSYHKYNAKQTRAQLRHGFTCRKTKKQKKTFTLF